MNLLLQRLSSLRSRAVELQTCLRRWAMYDDHVPHDWKSPLLGRFTPAEESAFKADLELTRARLRPASAQIQTGMKWYDYVLEGICEQMDHANALYEQGRHRECAALLIHIERHVIEPNEETLGFFFRCLAQHACHEYHQKLAAIDAIIRSLYLPTAKAAHQRGLLSREALSQTPLAYLTDDSESIYTWRQHAAASSRCGKQLPLALLAIPRRCLAEPWNLVAVVHEVARCIQADLGLAWETAAQFQVSAASAQAGVGLSPSTAPLWSRWNETVFADVLATIKLGPTYVSGMVELLGAIPQNVGVLSPAAAAPPPILRWQVMLQTLHLLNFSDAANQIEQTLRQTFGDFERFGASLGTAWGHWLCDCRAMAQIIAFAPFQKLGGARLVDIAQPFLASEAQTGTKVRDLLLAGDASIASDEAFRWIEPIGDTNMPAHLALAGLRAAYEQRCDVESSKRLWVRFWCLMQHLTESCDETREREDREFAPADATLRQFAHQFLPATPAVTPAMMGVPVPGIPVPGQVQLPPGMMVSTMAGASPYAHSAYSAGNRPSHPVNP